jgi:hypothetical protein
MMGGGDMTKALLTAATILFTAGCGHDDMDMTHSLQEMQAHLDGLQGEATAHDADVGSASDLAAILRLESGHYQRSVSHADGMTDNMGDMHMCHLPSGARPDLTTMAGQLEQVRAECRAHQEAMARVSDAAGASAEEGRHQLAMHGFVAQMARNRQEMMTRAGGYSCPMHGAH